MLKDTEQALTQTGDEGTDYELKNGHTCWIDIPDRNLTFFIRRLTADNAVVLEAHTLDSGKLIEHSAIYAPPPKEKP